MSAAHLNDQTTSEGSTQPGARAGAGYKAEHERLVAEITALRAQLAALNRDNESLEALASLTTVGSRYQTLFESSIIGVFAGDLGGCITEANDAFLGMLGYSREFLQTGELCWEDLIPQDDPDIAAKVAQGIAAVQSSRVLQPHESRFLHRDGHVVNVLLGGAMFEDSVSRGFCFALDLTASRQAQRALEESEQRFKSLFDHNPAGIIALDRQGRYIEVNPASTQISGYTREELLEMTFQPMLVPEDLEKAHRAFLRTLQGEPVVEEMSTIGKNGDRVEIISTSVPIFVDGEVVGVYGIVQDITERKRAEAALRASEERYRAFVSQSTESIWRFEFATPVSTALSENEQLEIFFQEAVLAECNDSMAHMYGFDNAGQIVGKNVSDFLPRNEENTEYLRSWIRNGYRLVEAESQEVDRQGNTKYFSNSFAGILEEGLLLRAWGTQRDITERKKIEAAQAVLAEAGAIFASSLDYQTTLQNVANLIVPKLADMCLVDIADGVGGYERLMVVASEEADKAVVDYMRANCLINPEMAVGPEHVVITGETTFVPRFEEVSLETIARNPDALKFLRMLECKSYVCVPMMAGGRILGAISFISAESSRVYAESELPLMRDIADRAALAVDNARLYQQAEIARQDAERANRTKDEFLAVVSHELRTPLTPMLGWLDLMKSGSLTPERFHGAVEAIERNAKMQMQLVNDLLDVSRIISGTLRLEKGRLDLKELIESTAEMIRPSTQERHITFTCEAQDVGEVIADSNRMQQVIWNILANANKFTPEGGKIDLTLERLEKQGEEGPADYACIRVKDSGIGIEADFLPRVFERFQQADSSTTRRQGGLGLGLSIVRHIVEMHDGTVTAHSEGGGKGAEFVVCLPLVTSANRDTPPALPTIAGSIGVMGTPLIPVPARLMDAAQILVVDDEADAREFLKESLGMHGANVRAAGSGAEALEIMQSWTPTVIVSDIGMSEMDGYDFIQRVREMPGSLGTVPAVALTAYAREQDRAAALQAGYDVHFSKPANTRILISAVAQLATKRANSPLQ